MIDRCYNQILRFVYFLSIVLPISLFILEKKFGDETKNKGIDENDACSAFAMVTSDHGPIVGRTTDLHKLPDEQKVYKIEKLNYDDSYRIINSNVTGMNEMGLAIGCSNSRYSGSNTNPDGPGSSLSITVLRYCPDVDSAVNFIRKYKISDSGTHFAMADISGKAAAVEKGPGDIFNVRWADSKGYVFVTNSPPDSIMRTFLHPQFREDIIVNSDNRYTNLNRMFSDSSFTFTLVAAESIIFNHDSIGAICQNGEIFPDQWYTLKACIMLPNEGRLLIAGRTSADQQEWWPPMFNWIEDTLTMLTSTAVLGKKYIFLPPEGSKLAQNYPNPFNSKTTISYSLNENTHLVLTIYNLMGEQVKILKNEFQSRGRYSILWDGTDEQNNKVASGIFIIEMKAGDFFQRRKITLLQ